MIHQIQKQVKFLNTRGFIVEVIICIPLILKGKYEFPRNYRIVHVSSDIDIGTLRNTCCNEAHGEYIAIMDDDDYYPEYRIYRQWQQLFLHRNRYETILGKYPTLKVCTVDKILCYDIKDKKSYWYLGSSESCLFFERSYMTKDGHSFGQGTGEGGEFAKGQNIMIEDSVELIIAMRHPQNTFDRKYTSNETEGLPDRGFPSQIVIDNFEREFLENIY